MNKDKIIKDLKERNNKLENQRRQFESRLYNEQHLVERKDKEIEKLNNIINEYENYMFGQLQLYGGGGMVQEYYDKLKELKENNE